MEGSSTIWVFFPSTQTWMKMEAKAPFIPTLKNHFLLISYTLAFHSFHFTLFLHATSLYSISKNQTNTPHSKALFKAKEREKDEPNMGFCGVCCSHVCGWEWTIIGEAIGEDSEGEEGVWQRVGVQGLVCLLLQRYHLWLLPDLPVWEPLCKAQFAGGTCRWILGLPFFYHCCSTVSASRLWHHRRNHQWPEGGRRFPWPCWQQNLLWVTFLSHMNHDYHIWYEYMIAFQIV